MENKCTYCWQKSDNLKPLPLELKGDDRERFCPNCYPSVLKAVKNLPWNK
jgi:hypothetical protein